jgi:hypothetical protein
MTEKEGKESRELPLGLEKLANIPSMLGSLSPYPRRKSTEEKIDEILAKHSDEVAEYDNKCFQCKRKIDGQFSFFYLKKHEEREDESILKKVLTFCSPDCLEEFKKTNDVEEFDTAVEASRCSCYYECSKLGNLRNMCEREDEVKDNNAFMLLTTPKIFCKPGDASIIKSNIKINETLQKFAKESNKQFDITRKMTILVIVLTIVNLFFFIISSRSAIMSFFLNPFGIGVSNVNLFYNSLIP